MQYKKPSQNRKKRIISKILIILLVITVALVALEKTGTTNLYTRKQTSTKLSPEPTNTVNYDPPTNEENNAGDVQKSKIVEQEQQAPPEQNTLVTANVVIVDATQYDNEIEVRAFASNILESGTCTYEFRNGQQSVQKSQPAYPDASTSPCTTLTIPRSEFSIAGKWNMTVTYASSSSRGSATQEIEIK